MNFTEEDILGARILIVDDYEANVMLLAQMLEQAGHTFVMTTVDAQEVCDLHRRHHYDLLLLDLRMPSLDGFEVMERLKAVDTAQAPAVIVITGLPDDKVKALRAGARDAVGKPFHLAELRMRIRNVIETRLIRRELEQRNALLDRALQESSASLTECEARCRELIRRPPGGE